MDQLNDHDYYVARACAARDLAQRAASPAIATIHAQMARRYERTVAEIEQQTDRAQKRSGRLSQAAMQVVFVEACNLDEFYRVENFQASAMERHRP